MVMPRLRPRRPKEASQQQESPRQSRPASIRKRRPRPDNRVTKIRRTGVGTDHDHHEDHQRLLFQGLSMMT